jgi:hypothetical protein
VLVDGGRGDEPGAVVGELTGQMDCVAVLDGLDVAERLLPWDAPRPVARYLRVDRSHIIECRGEGMLRRKSVIDTHQFRTVGAGQRAVGAGRQRTTGDERPAGAASETRPKGTIGLQCPCRRVSNAILR